MLTASTAVGSGRSSSPGSPTERVLNGSSTIAATRARLATIAAVSMAANDAIRRWWRSQ